MILQDDTPPDDQEGHCIILMTDAATGSYDPEKHYHLGFSKAHGDGGGGGGEWIIFVVADVTYGCTHGKRWWWCGVGVGGPVPTSELFFQHLHKDCSTDPEDRFKDRFLYLRQLFNDR